ncbi:MAG: triose-phosphate isomerase [Desulfobacterales bacterium]|nr:triose-phosphate isomerase [Desulfobacterales bacterium]
MASRKPLIAGNWKMFKTCPEAETTSRQLVERVGDVSSVDIMIAPPFTALAVVSKAIEGSSMELGAQNLYWEKEGAFTGEVSAPMIASAGCRYVIIGHSERRQFFGETDAGVNKKIQAAFEASLIPVVCVGETEPERDSGKTFSVLDKQIQEGLKDLNLNTSNPPVIAYEPVWAIGTGKTAQPEQAQEAHAYIRKLISQGFGDELASAIRILYGGSVKPGNIAELMALPDIDGALVGGASLKPETFSEIIHYRT